MDTKTQVLEIINSGLLELEPVDPEGLAKGVMQAQRSTHTFTAENDTFLIHRSGSHEDSVYSPTVLINRLGKTPMLYFSYTCFLDPTWRKLANDISLLIPDTMDMVIEGWCPRATLRDWLQRPPVDINEGLPSLYVGISSKMYEKVMNKGLDIKDFDSIEGMDDDLISGFFFYGETGEDKDEDDDGPMEMVSMDSSSEEDDEDTETSEELDLFNNEFESFTQEAESFTLCAESQLIRAHDQIIDFCQADGSREGYILKVDPSRLDSSLFEGMDYDLDFNNYLCVLVKYGYLLYTGGIDPSNLRIHAKHKVENVPSPELRIVDSDF